MLQGTLDDFALTDVFRLVSLARKTGKLEVERQAGRGKIFFHKGDVYYAESSLAREPLGQKLIRSGAVTEGQLRRALDEHAGTGRRIGEILVGSGTVSPEELEDAVRGQIEDAVFDLLRWELGTFAWERGEEVDAEVPISVSAENLIMEASRRLDELDIITRKIPSPDVVVAMASQPPEGAAEINITAEEWRSLVLVDGVRSVSDIAESVGLERFSAMRTLYGLVSAGLVEVISSGEGGDEVGEEAALWRVEADPVPLSEDRPEAARPGPDDAASRRPLPGPFEDDAALDLEPAGSPSARSAAEPPAGSASPPMTPDAAATPPPQDEPAPHPAASAEIPASPSSEAGPERARDVPATGDPERPAVLGAGPRRSPESAAPPSTAPPEGWFQDPESPAAPRPSAFDESQFGREPLLPSAPRSPSGTGGPQEPAAAAPDRPAVVEPAPGWTGTTEPAPERTQATEPVERAGATEPELAGLDGEPGGGRETEREEAGRAAEAAGAPRLDRAAVARELAGLFGDDQPATSARRPTPVAEPVQGPDTRRRVEDDDQVTRGLISRLIDGVKGL